MRSPTLPAKRNVFNVLGFPTTIKPGFGIFLAFLVFIYPFPLGLWMAAAVGIFTLIHELGHALAARMSGCTASISLDFMVAYAAYEPRTPLTWGQKARIAIAGPSLQITCAIAVLLLNSTNPFSRADITISDATIAIWWAGIALGVLNLVPLLPLDGGAFVASIVERFMPGRGNDIVLKSSTALTAVLFGLCIVSGYTEFAPVLVFMLFMQYQTLALPQRQKKLLLNPALAPEGDPEFDAMVSASLLSAGDAGKALRFATEAYRLCPADTNAFIAARSAMKLGDHSLAVQWLRISEQSQIDSGRFQILFNHATDFDQLRGRSDMSDEWFTNR
jgi:Zn-dependent protease